MEAERVRGREARDLDNVDAKICTFSMTSIVVGLPATSGHLRFGAKVALRGRWPPDTGTLTQQRQ